MGSTAFRSRLRTIAAWAYSELRPYRWLTLGSWLLVTLLSVVSAAPILLARSIVKDFQGEAPHLTLHLTALAAAILSIGALQFVGTVLFATVNLRLRHGLEERYARRLALVPLSYYETKSSASLALASFSQIPLLAHLGEVVFRSFLQAGVTIAAALGILFHASPALGIACLALLPLFLFVPHMMSRSVERTVRRSFLKISEMHSSMLESLLSVKTIRTLGLAESRVQEVSRIAKETLQQERATLVLTGLNQFMLDVVFAAGAVLLLSLLHRRVAFGGESLPLGAAALAGFMLLAREARVMANGVLELRRTAGACDQLVDFLRQPEHAVPAPIQDGPAGVQAITFTDVGFAYDGTREVLSGIHMEFRRDHITGIVGSSGGGKSTLADLILRLREPTRGTIRVNDMDLRDVPEPWLRRTFSFVDQEPFLFDTTIRENVLLGAPGLDEAGVWASLDAASARGLIASLPRGLDSVVGEGGTMLSVGEKQRIALARALAAGPSVLVLDEATSALDPENEKVILDVLRTLKAGRVIILISHRERVNEICDRIYRIEGGRARLVKDEASAKGPGA